jgi:hypothetical protein
VDWQSGIRPERPLAAEPSKALVTAAKNNRHHRQGKIFVKPPSGIVAMTAPWLQLQ